MNDFRLAPGFEDVWRPPVRPRPLRPATVLRPTSAGEVRARLRRIVARTPEVMVKVTGRTRDAAHLAAHLSYVSRNGALAMEDRDGWAIEGLREVMEVARDWGAAAVMDPRRRVDTPLSVAVILSMPAGTDPFALRDAARAFAAAELAGFDHVAVLHTDQSHPHVHLTVRALGQDGARLDPRKADLERWRQAFACELRDRGVPAEATPRRARGVTRKAERGPLRRMRERQAKGLGAPSRVVAAKLQDAARLAVGPAPQATAWERRIASRQAAVRWLYLAQAKLLQVSADPVERQLGAEVEAFVRGMPAPDTERLALARRLRGLDASVRPKDRSSPDSGSERRR